MKRKILSLILVFAMTVSLLTVGTGAVEPTYGDTAGHWAESSIERWSAYGIIQGSNGLFDPNGQLTCAQLATILAKLLKLPAAKDAGFTDNTADAWYYDAINRCAAAGILNGNGDGTVTPEAPITRERAMVMLARALGIEPIRKPDLTKYTDAAQVSAYAQGYVAALIEAGIVGGVTADELAPQDNINRASTVTILDRAISTYADKAGATVKADGKGLVLVVAENVKITGAPEGTKIVVADGATGLTVNGKSVSAGQTYIVPKTEPAKPSSGSSGGYSHSHSYVYTDNGDGTHTGRCYANDSTLAPEAHNIVDGKCTVCGAAQTAESVASVKAADGTCTYYSTLPEAVAAAADGAIVTVVKNISLDSRIVISKKVTVDLNGKTVTRDMSNVSADFTRNEGNLFTIQSAGDLTLKDSTGNGMLTAIAPADNHYSTDTLVLNYGKFTLESGTIKVPEKVYYAVGCYGKDSVTTINGGVIDAQWGGVSDGGIALGSNGSKSDATYGFTLNINGGEIKGGEQTLYLPGAGKTTITGGKLTGSARGIEIRAGELTITGGEISANVARNTNAAANNGASGSYTGALVAVKPASVSASGYVGDIVLNISGGTFTNASGDVLTAVHETATAQDAPAQNVMVSVSDGQFTGAFNVGNTVNTTANDKLSITGGTFSSDPSAYVAEGYFSLPNENSTYTVVTADQITSGVTIQGIAGYEHRAFATVEDAFTTVKTDLEARCGLVEQPMDEAQFNAFFTDGGKITWTIYGEQAVTDNRTFSFGRAANRFGEGRHITEINIIGGNDTAALNLSAVNGTFALPYNWWNVADSANTALKCKNIKFNGIKSMPSGIYQCTLHPTTYEFDGCTFNGNLYSYQNFDVVMTIKNSTFNAPDTTTQYAFMSQGTGGTITLNGNTFNGYTRGVNLERGTANFVFTNNTITSTVSEPDRAAIQLTDGKSFTVTGNTVRVNAGNAFWFHEAAKNRDVEYTISGNDIDAPYIGYYATSFDVNPKITSSGNKFNNTDTTKCMKKGATVAEATNLTAIH